MKKILISFGLIIFALFSVFSQTRDDYIHKATMAGLSFKESVVYAELKEKAAKEGVVFSEKDANKLKKLELKIEQGEQKFSALKNSNPIAAEKKASKINSKTDENIERKDAMEAYENYIYNNKTNDEIPLNPKTGFPEIIDKPFLFLTKEFLLI